MSMPDNEIDRGVVVGYRRDCKGVVEKVEHRRRRRRGRRIPACWWETEIYMRPGSRTKSFELLLRDGDSDFHKLGSGNRLNGRRGGDGGGTTHAKIYDKYDYAEYDVYPAMGSVKEYENWYKKRGDKVCHKEHAV